MQKILRSLPVIILLAVNINAQKNFTLEQITLESASLAPKELIQLQWIPNSDDFAYLDSTEDKTELIRENSESGEKEVLIDLFSLNVKLKHAGIDSLTTFPKFTWTSSESIRLWANELLVEFRFERNDITILNNIPKEGENPDYIDPFKVAYTIDNNLYIADRSKQIQITNDEDEGIVNGQLVHRKEFGITKGTFWSPNNNYLAFYRKDETMVTDYPILDISKRPAEVNYIKYPMAGMKSEEVTVGVYNLRTKETVWLKTGEPKDHYLPCVTWNPDEKYIFISELNRDQNDLKLTKYDIKTGEQVNVLIEETSDKYVEPMNDLIFFENDPSMFIWTSRNDGWNHLYLYDAQGAKIKELTNGEWEVTDYDGLSIVGYNIFFTATEQSPIDRHYYKIDLDRYEMKRITNGAGVHKVIRNESGTKFLDVFNNLDIPYKVNLLDKDGVLIRTVYNAENSLKGYNVGKTEIFTLKSKDGFDLYCRNILPPNFDANNKYPVIVYVYGGPHEQLITNSWLGNAKIWLYYMAQNGFVIFTLDNRGTNYRGLEFEQNTFRQLGTIEIEDQIVGVNYLKSLSYIDTTRMGVYGWSYGGFMTTGLMTRTRGIFKVGVAGGAVIDWRYYEVMYTERYMDTPETNPEGYDQANLLNYVQNLKGKLLLVHGTSDPVVVWQHTLLYCQKATQLGIDIDYFPYLNHKHHVLGTDKFQLYQKITNYFLDNL